jgi:hypothetical protein
MSMGFQVQYLRQNENRLKTTLFLRLFSCPKMAKLEIGEGIEVKTRLKSMLKFSRQVAIMMSRQLLEPFP